MSQTLCICADPSCQEAYDGSWGEARSYCTSCNSGYCTAAHCQLKGDANYQQLVEEKKPHGDKPTCVLCRFEEASDKDVIKYLLTVSGMDYKTAVIRIAKLKEMPGRWSMIRKIK